MYRPFRSEEHTSELQSLRHLVCRLLLEKKKQMKFPIYSRIQSSKGDTSQPPSPVRARVAGDTRLVLSPPWSLCKLSFLFFFFLKSRPPPQSPPSPLPALP